MRRLGFLLTASVAAAACSLGAATWSSDVCGCSPAWQVLASDLELTGANQAEDLTLAAVQQAASRQVGLPLQLSALPDTGSGESCSAMASGARCSWQLWSQGTSMKGFEAHYLTDSTGKVLSVRVAERVWSPDSGT
jgi:hypothetical protein